MVQDITVLFRIFQFQNFDRTKKKIFKKEDDESEDKAQVGKTHSCIISLLEFYIYIYIYIFKDIDILVSECIGYHFP